MTASEFYAAKPQWLPRQAFRPTCKYVAPYGVLNTLVDGVPCKIVPSDSVFGKMYSVFIGGGLAPVGSPAEALAAARDMIRVQAAATAAMAAGAAARDAARADRVAKHQAKQSRRAGRGGV